MSNVIGILEILELILEMYGDNVNLYICMIII